MFNITEVEYVIRVAELHKKECNSSECGISVSTLGLIARKMISNLPAFAASTTVIKDWQNRLKELI